MKRKLKPNRDLVLQYFDFECMPMSIEESNIQAYETIFSDVLKGATNEEKEVLFYVLYVLSFDTMIWMAERGILEKASKKSLNQLKELYQYFDEFNLFRHSAYKNAELDFYRAESEGKFNIQSIIIKTGGKKPINLKFDEGFAIASLFPLFFKFAFDHKESLCEPKNIGKGGSRIRKKLSLFLNNIIKLIKEGSFNKINSKRQINIILGKYLSFIGYLPNENDFLFDVELDKKSYPTYESYLDQQVKRILEVSKE